MRTALGLTLLVGTLLLAVAWQRDRTAQAAADPFTESAADPADPAEANRGEDWSHLIVGRPSGAPSLAPAASGPPSGPAAGPGRRRTNRSPAEGPASQPGRARLDGPRDDPHSGPPPAEFTYEIQSGDTLSQICSKFYLDRGAISPGTLARAVARYNGLKDVNDIVAGDPLLLPALEALELE